MSTIPAPLTDLYGPEWQDADAISASISQGGWTPQQYRILISFFVRDRQRENAQFALTRALEDHPFSPELRATRGDILAAHAMYEEAVEEWHQAARELPDHSRLFQARLAWLAIRRRDFRAARQIAAFADGIEHPDMAICRLLMCPDAHANLNASQGATDTIVDCARLTVGMASGRPDGIGRRFPYAWVSLAIWCPETVPQAIASFYRALQQGEHIPGHTVEVLGPEYPVVPLTAARQNDGPIRRLKLLRKALEWHPGNALLLDEYLITRPDDAWLAAHIERHRLIPPETAVRALNHGSNGDALLNPPFLESYRDRHIPLQLTALGGADRVGASAYILTYAGRSLLLDCGLHPARSGSLAYPELDQWQGTIDAIVLSHGHLDHVGAISKVHNRWPYAPICCTAETKGFVSLLLGDMSRIRHLDHDRETYADVIEAEEREAALSHMDTLAYGKWTRLFPDCSIRLHPAGHICGAAMVEVRWHGLTILYTGDYCLHNQNVVRGTDLYSLPATPDLLISEATYACRSRCPTWQEQLSCLREAIIKVLRGSGTVLLPCFAIGRSQELVMELSRMSAEGQLPKNTPLYLSGLAYEACRRVAAMDMTFAGRMAAFRRLRPEEVSAEPCVIVASSGMMVRGSASAKIAKKLISMPNSGIFYCGYMDEETERENSSWLTRRGARATIDRFSLSAHVSSEDSLRLFSTLRPHALVLVHWGETDHHKQLDHLRRIRLDTLGGDCLTWSLKQGQDIHPCSPFYWLCSRRKGE